MKIDIIRAWKDEGYRWSLSEEERETILENPVGELELTDAELEAVFGGGGHDDDSNSDDSCDDSNSDDSCDDSDD